MKDEDLPKTDFAYVDSVEHVNHKPHPFMIGPEHFPKNGGMFIEPEQAPCAMRGCSLMYDQHTSDYVAFVKLSRDVEDTEVSAWLCQLKLEGWFANFKPRPIDGVAFVKTEFDFIITEKKEPADNSSDPKPEEEEEENEFQERRSEIQQ